MCLCAAFGGHGRQNRVNFGFALLSFQQTTENAPEESKVFMKSRSNQKKNEAEKKEECNLSARR